MECCFKCNCLMVENSPQKWRDVLGDHSHIHTWHIYSRLYEEILYLICIYYLWYLPPLLFSNCISCFILVAFPPPWFCCLLPALMSSHPCDTHCLPPPSVFSQCALSPLCQFVFVASDRVVFPSVCLSVCFSYSSVSCLINQSELTDQKVTPLSSD